MLHNKITQSLHSSLEESGDMLSNVNGIIKHHRKTPRVALLLRSITILSMNMSYFHYLTFTSFGNKFIVTSPFTVVQAFPT